jgi:hypothetical protein
MMNCSTCGACWRGELVLRPSSSSFILEIGKDANSTDEDEDEDEAEALRNFFEFFR